MRRLGRGAWAAQGEASGAATPGSGPHQQLCNKSPGLSVPGFVTTGKQDTAQHLCPDTLIVRPPGAGFELVARAPEEGGVVTLA